MTCIVGLVQNGKVHMAADSAASDTNSVHKRKDSKLFVIDEYLIGFSNSFRMGQILKHDLIPPRASKKDLERIMCIDFVEAVQNCLEKNKFIIESDEKSTNIADLIIGIHGRIFVMDTDFQMGEYKDNYFSIGSGQEYALGSLHSTKHIKTPKTRLVKALSAAAEYTMGVEPPFIYQSI
jgi:20S proteasome alpha/beta subunit